MRFGETVESSYISSRMGLPHDAFLYIGDKGGKPICSGAASQLRQNAIAVVRVRRSELLAERLSCRTAA